MVGAGQENSAPVLTRCSILRILNGMYDRPQPLDALRPPESSTATTSVRPGPEDPLASTNYWDWCPRCSNRLESMKCKYVCRRCGYYMSCADFD